MPGIGTRDRQFLVVAGHSCLHPQKQSHSGLALLWPEPPWPHLPALRLNTWRDLHSPPRYRHPRSADC